MRFIKNATDFAAAGRAMGTYMAVATLSATEMGLVTVMYFAQEAFTNGFSAFLYGIIAGVTGLILGVTGFGVVRYRRTNSLTVAEFFEKRYNNKIRRTAAILATIAGVLNQSMFPLLSSMFIVYFTGIPKTISVAGLSLPSVPIVMFVLLTTATVSAVTGGMVSLAFTDFIQFIFTKASMTIATVIIIFSVGFGRMVTAVKTNIGAGGFNPIVNNNYGWCWILWIAFQSILGPLTWMPTAMRTSSVKSSKVTKPLFTVSSLMSYGRAILPMIWALCALAVFGMAVPSTGRLSGLSQGNYNAAAMPYYLGQSLPVVINGFLLAGMLAAYLSTESGYLLSWASLISLDIIGAWPGVKLAQTQLVKITRIMVVIVAIIVYCWGVLWKIPNTFFTYLMLTGTMYFAGAGALMVAGLYWSKASSFGATLALILGAVLPLLNVFGKKVFGSGYPISDALAGFGAFVASAIGMVVGSYIKPAKFDINFKEKVVEL